MTTTITAQKMTGVQCHKITRLLRQADAYHDWELGMYCAGQHYPELDLRAACENHATYQDAERIITILKAARVPGEFPAGLEAPTEKQIALATKLIKKYGLNQDCILACTKQEVSDFIHSIISNPPARTFHTAAEPTAKQIKYARYLLRRAGRNINELDGMNRGEVSNLISELA